MDIKEKTKDSCITMIRITATIMIVICHLCTWLGYNALGLVFDVGVQIFFFVSGWCYSEKEIRQPYKWLKERWRKLCIPAYVWVASVLLFTCFTKSEKVPLWKYVFSHTFNLQGWDKVFPGIRFSWVVCVSECGPMWFLTALMFCYGVMLVVKHFNVKCTKKKELLIFTIVGSIAVCVTVFFGVCLEWIYVFFLGYFSRNIWHKVLNRQYVLITFCMIGAMIVRLLGKFYLDGTIWYESMIVYLTHNVLAVWIISTIRWINQRSHIIDELLSTRAMQWLDRYQYEVYLIHFSLLSVVSMISDKFIIRIIVFVILVIILSIILQRSCEIIKNKSKNYKRY